MIEFKPTDFELAREHALQARYPGGVPSHIRLELADRLLGGLRHRIDSPGAFREVHRIHQEIDAAILKAGQMHVLMEPKTTIRLAVIQLLLIDVGEAPVPSVDEFPRTRPAARQMVEPQEERTINEVCVHFWTHHVPGTRLLTRIWQICVSWRGR